MLSLRSVLCVLAILLLALLAMPAEAADCGCFVAPAAHSEVGGYSVGNRAARRRDAARAVLRAPLRLFNRGC
jgi:hypothetical protein